MEILPDKKFTYKKIVQKNLVTGIVFAIVLFFIFAFVLEDINSVTLSFSLFGGVLFSFVFLAPLDVFALTKNKIKLTISNQGIRLQYGAYSAFRKWSDFTNVQRSAMSYRLKSKKNTLYIPIFFDTSVIDLINTKRPSI